MSGVKNATSGVIFGEMRSMKVLMRRLLLLIAFAILGGGAYAEQAATVPRPPHVETSFPEPESKFRVTPADVKHWIGKPVYSDDNKRVGEITDLRRNSDNNVTEVYYESGGFRGIGAKHYEITAEQIHQVQGDRVVLTLNEGEAKGLPQVQDTR